MIKYLHRGGDRTQDGQKYGATVPKVAPPDYDLHSHNSGPPAYMSYPWRVHKGIKKMYANFATAEVDDYITVQQVSRFKWLDRVSIYMACGPAGLQLELVVLPVIPGEEEEADACNCEDWGPNCPSTVAGVLDVDNEIATGIIMDFDALHPEEGTPVDLAETTLGWINDDPKHLPTSIMVALKVIALPEEGLSGDKCNPGEVDLYVHPIIVDSSIRMPIANGDLEERFHYNG